MFQHKTFFGKCLPNFLGWLKNLVKPKSFRKNILFGAENVLRFLRALNILRPKRTKTLKMIEIFQDFQNDKNTLKNSIKHHYSLHNYKNVLKIS